MEGVDKRYLTPTSIIDSDNRQVIKYALDIIRGSKDPVEQAVKLYRAVRDDIRYDPYYPFYLPEHYRASNVLKNRRGFCIPKATLLCALLRACGIPSRLGFATVRNHLATKHLIDYLGTDLFVYHGYTDIYLEGKWVKATPTFNIEVCNRHKVPPLEFNGREDAIFHAYNMENKKYMEYIAYHGVYADVPVDKIVAVWEETYGRDRVAKWIDDFEASNGKKLEFDFEREEVVKL
nr:transglutaminase domain-containing protein [Desulfobacterales bacterium]